MFEREHEMRMKKYKICVIRPNQKTLTYSVDEYEIVDNTFIEFKDLKFDVIKRFDTRLVEIEVNKNE
jgi:hypothetical protein